MVYLDNHATTPVDPRVLKAMLPYLKNKFGNAASHTHSLGREAEEAVNHARVQVARLIHAEPREIIFMSGATEANNLALKGASVACREKGDHLITVSTEHKSVLDPCRRLEAEGFRVTVLPVDGEGLLNLKELERAITPKTILVSVMMANNEIGVVQPIAEIGKSVRERGILFHCDAVQAAPYLPIDVKRMNIDLLSLSAHKIYGPKGTGALYIRKSEPRFNLVPLLEGGAQERGLRSGTLNVPGIVGFGEACRLARINRSADARRLRKMRDVLLRGILKKMPETIVNGSMRRRLPNNLNVSFPGRTSADLIKAMPEIAVSTGSACLSSSPEPSYVLKALGVEENLRRSAIRFGLGRFTTAKDIDIAVRAIWRVKRGSDPREGSVPSNAIVIK